MKKPTNDCVICNTGNNCFERCFDEMMKYYNSHYPELVDTGQDTSRQITEKII